MIRLIRLSANPRFARQRMQTPDLASLAGTPAGIEAETFVRAVAPNSSLKLASGRTCHALFSTFMSLHDNFI